MRLLVATVVALAALAFTSDAAAVPSCDQHAGTGQCINPPVIWRPDYAG